jgi:hypothetical protein
VKAVEFPDTVLTEGKGGRLELRTLDYRGTFVMCKYLDPKTMKLADQKRKLMLKDEDGKILGYFIIPLKNPNRSLLISAKSEEKERQIWNGELGKPEEVWTN